MKNRLFMVLLGFSLYICADSQQDMDDALKKLEDGVWNGAGDMINGMGQSFGIVPSEYVYSFIVWNDTPYPICVLREDVINFMGATFDGKIEDNNPPLLLPFNNTGDKFYNKHLLFTVWLLTDSLDKPFFNGWEKAIQILATINPVASTLDIMIDTKIFKDFLATAIGVVFGPVIHESLKKYSIMNKMISLQEFKKEDYYYYRAYYDSSGMSSEYLGALQKTDDFVGIFFNNAEVFVILDFIKDDQQYSITMAPGSFSLLQSNTNKTNSIRPATLLTSDKKPSRVFNFRQAYNNNPIAKIPIAPEAIATVVCDNTDPKHPKCTPGPSKTYTYEVFNDHGQYVVGMQGLSIGRFHQPIPADKNINTPVVRDINPCECHLWVQSAAQFNNAQSKDKQSSSVALDLPSEQIWVYYQTKDYTFKQKVAPGTVLDFTLVRPQIAEKQAWLYVVSLATNDDAKAQAFLSRLASGKIGVGATSSQIQDFTISDNLSKILNNPLPNQNGIINDQAGSGINGVVLLVDGFLPRGVGSGPYYYTIAPVLLMPDQLSMMATSYTLSVASLPDPQKVFVQQAPAWIATYQSNAANVKVQVTQFLQQYGMDFLFDNPKDPIANKKLNSKGSIILDLLLNGPLSFKNPPLLWQAGTNNYVFGLGAKPDDWPVKT